MSFAVNQTSFTMTNSMSLSTHHSWHSLHTTSPQYVDKVCIFPFLFSVEDKKLLLPKYLNVTGCFFSPANYFCSVSLVPRNQLLSVAAACKVLIEFSLLRLENPDEACAVSQVRETNCMGDCNVVGLLDSIILNFACLFRHRHYLAFSGHVCPF